MENTNKEKVSVFDTKKTGQEIYTLIEQLFPLCRSITGNGVRETLRIIQRHIPLNIHEVPTGTKVFDWVIPKEWNIREAYVQDEQGDKIIDFRKNNLHVVGYSVPVDKWVDLNELQEHLYSLPELPDAIPYVTSYYQERWGFCIAHNERARLKDAKYKVFIDSELKEGALTYGELIIPGSSQSEVFLSTYICHPSMANNELSGPGLMTFLARWLANHPTRYTYRIVFVPETIGSITYLSRNLSSLKEKVIAGFNISCVGDERAVSYLPSRYGNTLADKVALHILENKHPSFIKYSFLERGSDERQYCSPGVDLPLCCLMRSKYCTYPEYHTSLDNLDLVTSKGLQESFEIYRDCIELLERNYNYKVMYYGEPQLGRHGLYPTISTRSSAASVRQMMNFLAYADGTNDLVDIAVRIRLPAWKLYPIVDQLESAGLIEKNNS